MSSAQRPTVVAEPVARELQGALLPGVDHHQQPVIISLDISHGRKGSAFKDIRSVILDSWSLAQNSLSHPTDHLYPLFWSCTYVFSESERRVKSAASRSNFGASGHRVPGQDRLALLRHIFIHDTKGHVNASCGCQTIKPFDSLAQAQRIPTTRSRPLVVVGHDLRQDLASLRHADFEIEQFAPVVAYLDTQSTAVEQLGLRNAHRVSLRFLCQQLGLSYSNMHKSGNDAMYTLLALLELAARSKNPGEEEVKDKLRELVAYAMEIKPRTIKKMREEAAAKRTETRAHNMAEDLLSGYELMIEEQEA
ncbi:hypothetical protein BDV96DRAFT_593040 [Lophiotrema nucula]|uniref:Gfd2/YDR514C-like C-terminal domain-containing protein n=1 Tax=Lophiotrema nucula TaxID=690887 RepID=A0A6A5ZUM0_9PLEO|nr:hypothetical protein BDV96DRAFT_593040 [Lophiotrema nucula]